MTDESLYAELRAADLNGREISGVVIGYGDEARIGRLRERIEPGALTLPDDAIIDLQHDRTAPLARSPQVQLTDGSQALTMRATLPAGPRQDQALADIRSGILRGLSAQMVVDRDRYEGDLRIITAGRLVRFSVVDSGAYPKSIVEAREAAAPQPDERREYHRWL